MNRTIFLTLKVNKKINEFSRNEGEIFREEFNNTKWLKYFSEKYIHTGIYEIIQKEEYKL
jgi:hypothetical protein